MRVAVVGCGAAGTHHLEAVPAAGGVVAAACDEDAERAAATGAPVASFEDVVTDAAIDVVAISTPPDGHVPLALRALSAGKAVVVEKPVALTSTGLLELLAAAQDSRRPLVGMLQHRGRLTPAALAAGWSPSAVGTVEVFRHRPPEHYVQAPWRGDPLRSGGGVFAHLAIHYVDLACQLLGRRSEASALVDCPVQHGIDLRVAVCARMATGALLTVAGSADPERRSNRLRVVDGARELVVTDAETWYRDEAGDSTWLAPPNADLRTRVYAELGAALRAGDSRVRLYELDSAFGAVELLEDVLEQATAVA